MKLEGNKNKSDLEEPALCSVMKSCRPCTVLLAHKLHFLYEGILCNKLSVKQVCRKLFKRKT